MALTTAVHQVRSVLEQRGTGCSLKEIVDLCPEFTWHQVFLAIDDLSQKGLVQVTLDAGGTYTVHTYLSDRGSCCDLGIGQRVNYKIGAETRGK
ncbi:MAG: hypothetical protein AB7P24_06475 [Nitrospira sp.]